MILGHEVMGRRVVLLTHKYEFFTFTINDLTHHGFMIEHLAFWVDFHAS